LPPQHLFKKDLIRKSKVLLLLFVKVMFYK